MPTRAKIARLLLCLLYLLNLADGVLTYKLTKIFGPEGELNPIWAPLLKSGHTQLFLILKVLIGSIAIIWLYARIDKTPEKFSKIAFYVILLMSIFYVAIVSSLAIQLW